MANEIPPALSEGLVQMRTAVIARLASKQGLYITRARLLLWVQSYNDAEVFRRVEALNKWLRYYQKVKGWFSRATSS